VATCMLASPDGFLPSACFRKLLSIVAELGPVCLRWPPQC
jgi:hypothetical protein